MFPLLRKKGVDVDGVLDKTKESLDTMNSTLALLRPFLPETKETAAVDRILSAVQVGVGNAEQLYKIREFPPEKRKEAARLRPRY